MLSEKVTVTEELLTITISYKKRKYANQAKSVHPGNVDHLIPENLKGKVRLIKRPKHRIANFEQHNISLSGEWQYEIIKEKPKPSKQKNTPARNRTRRTRTKKS